ncbi:hypothetical protein L195_g064001, partial [Trifolium pratense]
YSHFAIHTSYSDHHSSSYSDFAIHTSYSFDHHSSYSSAFIIVPGGGSNSVTSSCTNQATKDIFYPDATVDG